MTYLSVRLVSISIVLVASGAVALAAEGQGSPSSLEDEEAAVLGPPATAPEAVPATPPAPPPPPPEATARPPMRRVPPPTRQRADAPVAEEGSRAAAEPEDQTGFAIELATSGFASGALHGGLFLGGRTAGGIILGGILDYSSTSATLTPTGASTTTSSNSMFRLGAGGRYTFVRSADRLVDLYGAGDVAVVWRSVQESGTTVPGAAGPASDVSATGFTLGIGPGVRLWINDHIAIGYAAVMRFTYLSGSAGALTSQASTDSTGATTKVIAFDGTFQILGVF